MKERRVQFWGVCTAHTLISVDPESKGLRSPPKSWRELGPTQSQGGCGGWFHAGGEGDRRGELRKFPEYQVEGTALWGAHGVGQGTMPRPKCLKDPCLGCGVLSLRGLSAMIVH